MGAINVHTIVGGLVAFAIAFPVVPVFAAQDALPRLDGSISMDQAVNLALEHSRKIKAAAADQRAMRSMQGEATAGFFPQASANG